jgi:NAD(P)-dependent dehydrogenase (short-subunit alcohol dehydrogenase family)
MKGTVLITGASGNLGKVSVRYFADAGYTVAAVVSPGKKKTAKFPEGVVILEGDLSDEQQARNVLDEAVTLTGTLHAVLLLAGGYSGGNITSTSLASVKEMVALNFDTAYNIARPAFEMMKKNPGGGRIIFVGSRPALTPTEGRHAIAYALSKSMLFTLAEILNAEGSKHNIVSSVIAPGTIDTPANREAMPDKNFLEWVTPEEIAETMEFLCSSRHSSLREPILKLYGKKLEK